MNRVLAIPAGAVVISAESAIALCKAIYAAQDMAHRHGARISPAILTLTAEIYSAAGTPEIPPQPLNEPIEHELIDANTAAEILNCSPRNVRDLANRGRLAGEKIAGRWQFTRDDVEVFRDWR